MQPARHPGRAAKPPPRASYAVYPRKILPDWQAQTPCWQTVAVCGGSRNLRSVRTKKRRSSQPVSVSESLKIKGVPRSGSRPSTRRRPGLRPAVLGSHSEAQRDRTCLTDRDERRSFFPTLPRQPPTGSHEILRNRQFLHLVHEQWINPRPLHHPQRIPPIAELAAIVGRIGLRPRRADAGGGNCPPPYRRTVTAGGFLAMLVAPKSPIDPQAPHPVTSRSRSRSSDSSTVTPRPSQ